MTAHPDSSGPALRLLLVDTDAGLRFAIGDYFRQIGVEVDEAASVREAEAWLAMGAYDAVVTDLRLSAAQEAEGFTLARRIRTTSPSTAVCILTVPVEPTLMDAAESVANVVVTRPRKLADVAQVVFALLHDPAATGFTSTGALS